MLLLTISHAFASEITFDRGNIKVETLSPPVIQNSNNITVISGDEATLILRESDGSFTSALISSFRITEISPQVVNGLDSLLIEIPQRAFWSVGRSHYETLNTILRTQVRSASSKFAPNDDTPIPDPGNTVDEIVFAGSTFTANACTNPGPFFFSIFRNGNNTFQQTYIATDTSVTITMTTTKNGQISYTKKTN